MPLRAAELTERDKSEQGKSITASGAERYSAVRCGAVRGGTDDRLLQGATRRYKGRWAAGLL